VQPLVVIKRTLWNELSRIAVTATRETGGIVVGRRTRVGSIHCHHQIPLSHKWANEDQVVYEKDEVARARLMAYKMYGPKLEVLAGWHTHPFDEKCTAALVPQISDDDLDEIQEGDAELIIVTFPHTKPTPDWSPRSGDMILHRRVGPMVARCEPWKKVKGKAVPCRVALR
jgi:hypothetical protein